MAIVLWLFLLLTSLYHVLVTVFVYGLQRLDPQTIVILRDGFRFMFVFLIALIHRKHILSYLKRTRKLWVVFLCLAFLSVGVSLWQQKTSADIIIGAKYGLQFFVIFLMAIFLGHVFGSFSREKLHKFLRLLFWLFCGIILVGFIRQGAKMMMPEFFYQLGYAQLGDRVFGQNPPLYYLTGPGGYARLSGIFSGPNNYGYLFVGLFGFRRRYSRTYINHKAGKFLLWTLFAASLLRTLSRGAILGIFLQLVALSFVLFHAKRKYILGLILAGVVVVGALSVIKRGSTMAHVRAKFSSLGYVWENPWGYGLGSSGPSIHTGHGSILPENFFVQILIDVGIPGLILWFLFRYLVLRDIRTINKVERANSSYDTLLICLSFGFLGLLLEGMFLHVFEDSMVNYRFFVLRGIIYGYRKSMTSKDIQIKRA